LTSHRTVGFLGSAAGRPGSSERPARTSLACFLLWALFFLICFGLGYPTLNRYDPGVPRPDASQYRAMVMQGSAGASRHFQHRVLIPYLAEPVYVFARGHAGTWDAAYFGLLVMNSFFISGAAFCLFLLTASCRPAPRFWQLFDPNQSQGQQVNEHVHQSIRGGTGIQAFRLSQRRGRCRAGIARPAFSIRCSPSSVLAGPTDRQIGTLD
jgi:hypothetical protein